MIHSFSCKNFYSFSDKIQLSFVVNEKAPQNSAYFTAASGVRLSKIETVIGANASGKTNLLKVLPFFKWLVVDSFSANPANRLPVKPFLFGESKNQPSEVEVDFEISGNIYTYRFVLDEKQILKEELKVRNKTLQKITSKKIFSREWDKTIGKYVLDDVWFNLPKDFPLRSNASVVSTAIQFTHKESTELINYWQKVFFNVIEDGWIGAQGSRQLNVVLSFFSEKENLVLKQEAEKLLSRFDLGFKYLDIKKEKKENSYTFNVHVGHNIGGQVELLPLTYESSGTRQLLVLLQTILQALNTGGIAVLDEFDVNLHPEMIGALFDLFLQPEINSKNAQILFSTHSHLILNKLDKYQIVLTEKNDKGGSESWRLDEMAGVRADDNYCAKYLSGVYGAIPRI